MITIVRTNVSDNAVTTRVCERLLKVDLGQCSLLTASTGGELIVPSFDHDHLFR